MVDWRKAEEIYKKMMREGDITWQESDVIYQIAYDFLCRGICDSDADERKGILKKWYSQVLRKLDVGEKGIYLHTILQLEDKDRAVILTFKTKEDASKFFKGKAKLSLMGRKYKGFDYEAQLAFGMHPLVRNSALVTDLYQKYFFEIYRPLTLERIGLNNFVSLNIEDENFRKACATYGCNKKVYDMKEVYERAIEIMLDMNIPMYAYSARLFTDISKAEFDMLVDERYAECVDRIFRSLPHVIDSKFFETCKKKRQRIHRCRFSCN